ncbi:hypothetical protein M422DRAFT_29980 [Sphaerobolus stellatus SS14]|uniref:C2H2-type domain-containing protein n=1 Tax=Sphaerobolus stellatus (strain SS14) TaxID=990650 RepID=A0A0C9VRS6_SPHS4|nr:hypothetical protein M422DRAFT_29980 [Sphaerobolus stellatus SS14]
MTLPYEPYSFAATDVAPHVVYEQLYIEDSPPVQQIMIPPMLMHDEPSPNSQSSFQELSFSNDIAYMNSYPHSNHGYRADDYLNSLSAVEWNYVSDADVYVTTPEMSTYGPRDMGYAPETLYIASHHPHMQYPAEPTYTRMFRGRKSKSAAEVLDELRPYACDICQAAFARSHDRDRHKRSHTGETPYRCHGCGTGFKRPDARKRHWERDPICAREDWLRVRHTPEGAKRRARAKTKPKKQAD